MNDEKAKKLLAKAKQLAQSVIIGFENEQGISWPVDQKFHQCPSCYTWAKELQKAIREAEQP